MGPSRKEPVNRRKFVSAWDEIMYLRSKLLHWFYGLTYSRARARPFALRLEQLLRSARVGHGAIMAEECWSLVHEVKGDLRSAIKYRRSEIRLWKRFFSLPSFSPADAAIFGDYSDLADRLILLAMLYSAADNKKRAIQSLEEARVLAAEHDFPFEGDDLMRDMTSARSEPPRPRGRVRRTGGSRTGPVSSRR